MSTVASMHGTVKRTVLEQSHSIRYIGIVTDSSS